MSFSETTDRRVKPKTLIRLQPPDKDKLEQARKIRYGLRVVASVFKSYSIMHVCNCLEALLAF